MTEVPTLAYLPLLTINSKALNLQERVGKLCTLIAQLGDREHADLIAVSIERDLSEAETALKEFRKRLGE